MSLPVTFDPGAYDDLDVIEEYLGLRFYPSRAEKYVQRIIKACHKIGLAPYRGHTRNDLGLGVRAVGFEKRVTITFQIKSDSVVILGIWYAGRLPY